MRALTTKQMRFAIEYLVDLNGRLAAIRAGYCRRNAGIISNENLSNPRITKFIAEQKKYFIHEVEINRVKTKLNLSLMENAVLKNISKIINKDVNDDFNVALRNHYISSCLLKAVHH